MTDLVTIDKSGGIADVRLNRPEKYNALSPDMFKAIIEAGETLAEATDVRAVVLSGNGRGFCAGLDMASFQGMAGAPTKGSATAQSLSTSPTCMASFVCTRAVSVWNKTSLTKRQAFWTLLSKRLPHSSGPSPGCA